MAMALSRRAFIKLTGAGLATSSLGMLGFAAAGPALADSMRPFKLTHATETRNTCTYCSVACGILIYSLGDRSLNATSDIIHIEGDPDHPVNRGTLCPKGAALLDIVHAPTRLKVPKYRAPGSGEFKEVSWDFALDRIATLMKKDRDANFIAKNAAGATVNRWVSTGMLAASASSSETAYLTWKVARSFGMLVFDNQARV
jgi:formate dehydrogenase major subunit